MHRLSLHDQTVDALQAGRRLIEAARYQDALDVLTAVPSASRSSQGQALLGIAHFQLERYAQAAEHLAAALEHDPRNDDWRDLCDEARTNALAGLHEAVPPVAYFDRRTLLAPATELDFDLPAPPAGPEPLPLRRLLIRLGSGLGWIFAWFAQAATEVWGRLAGYRDRLWTNWYRRPMFLALLTLAYMRDKLNRDNLKSVYPDDVLTGFQAPGQRPPPGVARFRTPNGSWNNLDDPSEGAAGTRFGRNVQPEASLAETGDRLLTPNPRVVSLELLTREEGTKEIPFLNLLAASWIQFQVHDWVSHGENLAWPDVHHIPLAENDPVRVKYHQTKMFVGRTQPDPTRARHDGQKPVTHINEVTHWWDASQIYGSDACTLGRLISGSDGKLRLDHQGLLPVSRSGVEETGFVRNWWVGLAMLHTLFVKEHNSICDRLKSKYPHWRDDRLFHVARLINAAVIAKIHTVEWTPAILPNAAASQALNANWFGLATNLLRRGKQRRTLAALNIRQPELGGVVGNPADRHGVPFSLTEEFVEVYRLHSLLPEHLVLRRHDTDSTLEKIPIAATRQAASRKLTERVAMTDLFYSFGNQHPGQLVLNNFPRFMQEMSVPGNPVFDLGAVDILRARERGVPRYNEFRRQLGLRPIGRFEELTDDVRQVAKLKRVYGGQPQDVETLDLLIGTLAESHRPPGFGFGETLFQIFILNATRRLQADRFFTDDYNEQTYTPEGLHWVDDADFKTVLLRHYPELADTGLANVKNAFEPWDVGETLDLTRHPLRRFDRDLEPQPARGNAHR
ncbi:MAG: peroxidase family protein [Gammaproteobacteria bacterium]|nr:peroxidase family protein [Gammaproteobacteria bacterium]